MREGELLIIGERIDQNNMQCFYFLSPKKKKKNKTKERKKEEAAMVGIYKNTLKKTLSIYIRNPNLIWIQKSLSNR